MPARPYGEQLVYHHDFLRFHTRLVDAAKKWARAFRASYDGAFKTASFAGLLGRIDASETSVAEELFRNGRGADDVVWQIINFRMYRQIQACARGEGTLEGVAGWVDLFNDFIRCGTESVSGKAGISPALSLRIGDAEGFARYFLVRIVSTLGADKPCAGLFEHLTAPMGRFIEAHRETERFDMDAGEQLLRWVEIYDAAVCRELENG
jgi:hypothetical protein